MRSGRPVRSSLLGLFLLGLPLLVWGQRDTVRTVLLLPDSLQLALDSLWESGALLRPPGEGKTGLELRGSLRRGVLLGSGGDPTLSSALEIELEGELTEGVRVRGLLSDQSVPLFLEGSTRPLAEFERARLEVFGERFRLALGNLEGQMALPLYNRRRRLEGLEATYRDSLWGLRMLAGRERGRFQREVLELQEGVLGPYRLRGALGESLIWIVAGSERVYWNGVLLEREVDYRLDYATGELFFSASRLPRRDTRVEVTFEYVSEATQRSIWAGEVRLGRENGGFRMGWLREADQPASGADLQPASPWTGPRQGGIFYVRADTLWEGQPFVFWRLWRGEARDTVWNVRFRYVGPGKGAYERFPIGVGGIAYQWVGPGRGRYEVALPLPKGERYRGFLEFPLARWGRLYLEGLLPRPGFIDPAFGLRYANSMAFLSGRGSIELSYSLPELVFAEEALPPDWGRYWNVWDPWSGDSLLRSSGLFRPGALGQLRVNWHAEDPARGRWEVAAIRNAAGFEALRLEMQSRIGQGLGGLVGWSYGSDRIQNQRSRGGWALLEGKKTLPSDWGVGARLHLEGHQGARAYRVGEGELWVAIPLREEPLRLSIEGRLLEKPSTGHLSVWSRRGWRRERAELYIRLADLRWRRSRGWGEMHAGYLRSWTPTGGERSVFASEGQAVWLFSPASPDREVRLRWSVGRTQEPLTEEIFLPVGPELGQYVWEDHNGDGHPQLDEFRPAALPGEGRYIRLRVPSDRVLIGFEGRATLSWRWLDPRSRWQYTGALQGRGLKGTSGMSPNYRWGVRHTLELAPLDPDRRLTLEHERSRAREQRALGEEQQQRDRLSLSGRFPLIGRWYGIGEMGYAEEKQYIALLPGRNVALRQLTLQLGAMAQVRPMQYAQGLVVLTHRQDRSTGVHVQIRGLDGRLERPLRGHTFWLAVETQVRHLVGQHNRYGWAAFLLTDGFSPGWNVRWSGRLSWRLPRGLEVWAEYSGQASPGLSPRTWAQLQLRMSF
nr:MAG: hypothetical protein KatS3mg041_1919 [Bacteroidota bacterium]